VTGGPVEADGLLVVGVEREPDDLQRLEHLVAHGPDHGELGFGRQAAAGPHGELLDPA